MQNETMEFDVVIVGAGPAGLSAAIAIKQLANKDNVNIDVCLIEKSAEIGGHILSGAIFEPTALNELIPDWRQKYSQLFTEVSHENIYFLSNQNKALNIPKWLFPNNMHNAGNFVISLGQLTKKLAEEAENLGVNVFSGFSIVDIISEDNKILGIITGKMGVDANNIPKANFVHNINIMAKYTIFAEGCRGNLGKKLIARYNLDKDKTPQHYALGVKEVWQIDKSKHIPGLVTHTIGWPLAEHGASGGGAIYHFAENLVSVNLITDLSYKNPYLSPFDEMQRFKTHALIKDLLHGGERISYGAKSIAKGGLQAQIKMTFPGGVLIGDELATLNAGKIKGIHTAMKSGMLTAQAIVTAIKDNRANDELIDIKEIYQSSWLYQELYQQRNFAPAINKYGMYIGSIYNFIDSNIFHGKLPWTLKASKADYQTLSNANKSKKINYLDPDNQLTFDKASSLYLANITHNNDQPNHLQLADADIPITINLKKYAEPAQYYCPAGVYEIVDKLGQPQLQINSQNCIHCKTCDIKDPSQNINWSPPEGGSGPNYIDM